MRRRRYPHRDTAVNLLHLPLLYDLVHLLQSHGIFGTKHQSAGVSVDTVAQRGRKAVFLRRIVLALLVQVLLHPPDERIRRPAFVLMHHQTRGLIRYQYVFILIDDRKRIPRP